jgi:hypothetical protein
LLALIADTLQPADFEELKKFGFGDDRPAGGRLDDSAAGIGTGGGTASR